jgi:hypothetical protein
MFLMQRSFLPLVMLAACTAGESGGEVSGASSPPAEASSNGASSSSGGAPSGGTSSGGTSSGGTSSGGTSSSSGSSSSSGNADGGPTACPIFPGDAIFNTRIDDAAKFPASGQSNVWIASIGTGVRVRPDWGSSEDQANWETYYGIPSNRVNASLVWTIVSHKIIDPRDGNGAGVPNESDCGVPKLGGGYELKRDCSTVPEAQRYFPYPSDGVIKAEFGTCNDSNRCGDRHVLVVDESSCQLWESYFSYKVSGQWNAYSTAAWDLRSNAMRPDKWTSADAAGLPIYPMLVRQSEAAQGTISHALRVTFRDAVLSRTYTWPASHAAGGMSGSIPFGSLLRMKASATIPSEWTVQAKTIAKALQQYGAYVADIGTDFFVQGEPNMQWEDATTTQLRTLTASQFEFVDLGAVTRHPQFSARSYRGQF